MPLNLCNRTVNHLYLSIQEFRTLTTAVEQRRSALGSIRLLKMPRSSRLHNSSPKQALVPSILISDATVGYWVLASIEAVVFVLYKEDESEEMKAMELMFSIYFQMKIESEITD